MKLILRIVSRPWLGSLLTALVFFALLYGVLRPGYWINDDLKIIFNAIGYPAGGQVPFLIHTNILIGFLLVPLYALHTALNWEILLFALTNLCATWALLNICFAFRSKLSRLFAAAAVLVCAAWVLFNITYTITAAWACLAGLTVLFAAATIRQDRTVLPVLGGIALLLLGSMIRIQSMLPVLGFSVPGIILVLWRANWRRLLLMLAAAGLVIGAGYLVDRLYVRSSPDWNYYYHYNATRELLHDAHRLENAGFQIRHVGWSSNDQELFAHWFFPDPQIYSLDHIRYLVNHIPGTSQDLSGLLTGYVRGLAQPAVFPLLVLMVAALLWGTSHKTPWWVLLAACCTWALALFENAVLAWAYKDPDYLLLSTLAGSTVFGLIMIGVCDAKQLNPAAEAASNRTSFIVLRAASAIILLLCILVAENRTITLSEINVEKQSGYERIAADLRRLQSEGKIRMDTVILSPAHGLPADWTNPFVLNPPPIPYYDMGWVTFSPPYTAFLQNFDISSVPDAFYRKQNVYLMTQSNFTVFLGRYYQEHEGLHVTFLPVYAMPNTYNIPDHDDIFLYKVLPAR